MALLHIATGVIACVAARAEARNGRWLPTLAWLALAGLQGWLLVVAQLADRGAA